MRVLVVGGTGVLGTYLVPELVRRGHTVTVLARSASRDAPVRAAGATPVRGDVLDGASVHAAMTGHEVVIHAATQVPRVFPGKPADFAMNDRIRREGTAHLLAAAQEAGVARVVLQSIIWVHGDHGDAWIDETAALRPGALTQSAVDMEAQARDHQARTGAATVVLRCGSLYAAESWHTREIVHRLRHRLAPIIGQGENFQGFLHAADAATAFAAAAEGPAGTFLVTDDTPAQLGTYLTWLAGKVGGHPPLHLPHFMARLALGHEMVAAYGSSLRCRNTRMREAFGWRPRYPSFREGYGEVLPRLAAQPGAHA
jgi:nucleoside-diphosphate-sugar epimerase